MKSLFVSARPSGAVNPYIITYMGTGYARIRYVDELTGIEQLSEINFPRNGLMTMISPDCRMLSIEVPDPFPEVFNAFGEPAIVFNDTYPPGAIAVYSRNGVYKLSYESIYFDGKGDPT